MRQLDGMRDQLNGLSDAQISTTDPNSRSMTSAASGSGLVGYNMQTAVDAEQRRKPF